MRIQGRAMVTQEFGCCGALYNLKKNKKKIYMYILAKNIIKLSINHTL